LIAEGHLVGTRVFSWDVDPKGVRTSKGDYVESELEARMNTDKLVGDIISHHPRLAKGRKTVLFASGVEHSVHLAREFQAAGVRAEHLDGSTPIEDRESILARLSSGDLEVVSNCMVLTEGWDQPDVSCLVLARPTKSLGLYLQMAGRCLRPSEGKSDVTITPIAFVLLIGRERVLEVFKWVGIGAFIVVVTAVIIAGVIFFTPYVVQALVRFVRPKTSCACASLGNGYSRSLLALLVVMCLSTMCAEELRYGPQAALEDRSSG
jgi:hypothetical protein